MKKIIIVLIFLLLTAGRELSAQSWINIYGQGLNANAYNIIETYDHGYIVAAQIDFGRYMWIFKTNINGLMLWDKRIGTGMDSKIFSPMNIEETTDKGFIISGSTSKYGSLDAFIMKLNSCGEIVWSKVLQTPDNFDEGWKVLPTPQGDFILMVGYFKTDPASNISLFKFDNQGDLIWHQFYPQEYYYNDDQPCDLLVDADGYLVTAARYAPDSGTTSPQIIRSYFIKTDTAGNKLWDLVYGVNNHYYSDVWETVSNNMGKYYHSCSHSGASSTNPGLIWISHNGSESGDKDLVETNNPNFCGMPTITMFNDTNLIFFGGYRINNVFQTLGLRTDTSGNVIASKPTPNVNSSYTSTAKTFDNKLVTVGNDAPTGNFNIVAFKVNSDLEYDSIYTRHFTYDSLCPHPIVSDTVDPNCENVYVSVDEPFKKPETTKLKVYPNPTDKQITIELPKYLVITNSSGNMPATTVYHQWTSATLQMLDLKGEILRQREVENSPVPLQWDVSQLPPGMYLLRLLYKGSVVADSKVVVR